MPKRADGYQQNSGFVNDPTLYDGDTATGYDRTLTGAAQVSDITVLLDLGPSPTATKKIKTTMRFSDLVATPLVEYADSLAGPWTAPGGSGSTPLAAGCTPTTSAYTFTLTAAISKRFWRVSHRNTDTAGCGSSLMGCREIEALDATNLHIAENPGPTAFGISPSSQSAYMGVPTGAFTITLDAVAGASGEQFSLGDASAGGTFSPVSPVTVPSGQTQVTFTYSHTKPGAYTITVTDVTSSLGAQQVTVNVGGATLLSGGTPDDVAAKGLREYTDGESLSAATINDNDTDHQSRSMKMMPAGVLKGGVCTSPSSLVVRVPAGTEVYARQTWTYGSNADVAVPDNATTALWHCADGLIRTTSSTGTRPIGFDERNCALLTKVTTAAGVTTVDNTVQERGRYVDGVNRRVLDNAGVWAPQPDNIPAGVEAVVPAGHQLRLKDSLTVLGTVTIHGRLYIE